MTNPTLTRQIDLAFAMEVMARRYADAEADLCAAYSYHLEDKIVKLRRASHRRWVALIRLRKALITTCVEAANDHPR